MTNTLSDLPIFVVISSKRQPFFSLTASRQYKLPQTTCTDMLAKRFNCPSFWSILWTLCFLCVLLFIYSKKCSEGLPSSATLRVTLQEERPATFHHQWSQRSLSPLPQRRSRDKELNSRLPRARSFDLMHEQGDLRK